MNRATPPMRDFAVRLIAFEVSGARSTDSGAFSAFAVPDKMRIHLTTLMGNGGHRALLMRALVLAGEEVPWLRDARVAPSGNLERPIQEGDPNEKLDNPDGATEGGVVLVAHLIGLLVAFIGERLTLQLVREVWPKLPAEDLNFKI